MSTERNRRISVEVPVRVLSILNRFAECDGIPRSQVIRRAIDSYIKEQFEEQAEAFERGG